MSVEAELLARARLTKPDGRPLFAWDCDEHQRRRLAQDLTLSIAISPAHPITAARFVLWAAEEIRAHHKPGHLTWEWLFGRLERTAGGNLGRDLTERGLAWWGRAVPCSGTAFIANERGATKTGTFFP